MTFREVRRIKDPRLLINPYPNHLAGLPSHIRNPHFSVYTNKFLLPSLFKPEDFKLHFGYGVADFYDIRYVLQQTFKGDSALFF